MVVAKARPRIGIPLQKIKPFEKIWSVLPWFLRTPDQPPAQSSPHILTFTEDRFMPAFFRAIETIDSGDSLDGFEKLIPFRDYSEPPANMVDALNVPLYPSSMQREPPLFIEMPVSADYDQEEDGVPTDDPPWLRKLYLPLHQHFHLITTELVCRRFGFPKVGKQRIIESGIVVRRLVADRHQERWEDWIAGPEGHGTWLEIADKHMQPLHVENAPPIDPGSMPRALFGSMIRQELLAYRLGLETLDQLPQTLTTHRMSLIPSSVGQACKHTAFFGYLPLQSKDQVLPEIPDSPDTLGCVGERLKQRARRVLGELFFSEPQFEESLPAPLPPHITDHINKLDAALWEGSDHPEQSFKGLRTLFHNTILPNKPESLTRKTLVDRIGAINSSFTLPIRPFDWRERIERAAFLGFFSMTTLMWNHIRTNHESSALQESWWNNAVDAGIINAVRSQLTNEWTRQAILEHQQDFKDLIKLTVYLVLEELRDYQSTSRSWDHLNLSEKPSVDQLQQLVIIALIRIRAYRKHLLGTIYDAFQPVYASPRRSDLEQPFEEVDPASVAVKDHCDEYPPSPTHTDTISEFPSFTVSSHSSEITAWIEAEKERVLGRKQWEWPSLGLVNEDGSLNDSLGKYAKIHLDHTGLEAYLSRFEQATAQAEGAITDQINFISKIVLQHIGDFLPACLRKWGVDINEQTARGLLVMPGFPVQPDVLERIINGIVTFYGKIADEQDPEGQKARAIAENAQRLRRPKFDSDSLYAVWVYYRIAGRNDCEQEQVLWSGPSDVFSIAEPTDVLGARPVSFQLPDLVKLIRDIPRIARAKALPYAAVHIPKNSNVRATGLENISRTWGMSLACTYGIPVFTICAWVAFQIIFNILLYFGFGWFLLLKFCFPGSSRN